ncbi:MAG: TonB-dependent receptor [Gammaproteobacteria bacterium]
MSRTVSDCHATLFRRALLCAISALSLGALADNLELEEVQVTATRSANGTSAVSEAISIVGESELNDAQIQVITDALRGQTGVFIQQTTPGQGTAIVRGLKGSEVLHLVDGMRLNNALFRNAPNQYLALVDPFATDRIEVVRGPLSTLYGSDAMGGVLQVVTDRPFLGGGDWAVSGRALARYDSRTLGNVAHASIAAGQGNFGFGGAVSVQDHQDVRAADRRVQAPSGYRSQAASAFLSWRPNDRQRNELSIQYLEQPSTPRFDELVAGFGQTEPASEVFEFAPNSRLFIHAQHYSEGWSKWVDEFEVHAAVQTMTDDRRTRDTGATSTRVEQNDSQLFGLTLRASAEPTARHAVTYGVDMYFDEVGSARQQVDVATGESTTVASRFPDGSTLDTIDLYVQDAMTLSDRLSLTAGGRVSRAQVELTATESGPAANISNTDVTGSLGLRYDLNDQWSLMSNLGRGFRAPNIFDLGTLGVRPGNRFNIANSELGPETVWTLDAGFRVDTDRLSAEFFLWASDYTDQIVSVSTGDVDDVGREIVQSQNASQVDLHGAELATSYVFSENWSAEVGVNWVWGRTDLEDGEAEPADRIPPLNGRLGVRYEQASWWLDTQLRFAQAQGRLSGRDVRDPRIDPFGTAGWGLLNVRGGVQWNDVFSTTVGLHNLTDRDYREHGSGIDGAGRSVVVTLEGRF